MASEIDKSRAIRGKRRSHRVDAAIAAAADRQEGVIDRAALRQIGLGDDAIDGRIQAGRLHQIHRGVYALGRSRLSRNGRFHAALLFAGRGAVLSHRSAADLWELRASEDQEIDVTAVTDRRGDAIVPIHRDYLDPKETMTRDGIRVTKPLRTLLDLAASVTDKQLERAIRQAVYRRLTTTALLAEAVHKRKGRRGVKKMRKALIRVGEAPGRTRSDLEDDFLDFLRKHRLPMPELNVKIRIGGRRVESDCVWRDQRVIVELDGRDAHDSTPAFEADRERDLGLLAAGWKSGRITNRRMRHDGKRLANELRAILG